MFNFFDLEIIHIILNRFKVNNVVISGLDDKNIIRSLCDFCCNQNKILYSINCDNVPTNFDFNLLFGNNLKVLSNLQNYDAIFINNCPSWYNIYSELDIIKKNNSEFPLVFICNNRYPFEFRDAYDDPNNIPAEYCNEYQEWLPISFDEKIIKVYDGFYHAKYSKTPKNGVQVAINDFLLENTDVGLLNLKLGSLSILYPKSTISSIRINHIFEDIDKGDFKFQEISDEYVINRLLCSNFLELDSYNFQNEKLKLELDNQNELIKSYENKIQVHVDEINHSNNLINNYKNKLGLSELQIKQYQSELINHKNEISILNQELEEVTTEINYLKKSYKNKESNYLDLQKELKKKIELINEQLNDKELEIIDKENQLKISQDNLQMLDDDLRFIRYKYYNQLSKMDTNEYCISCYKEKLSNNNYEMDYAKKNVLIKKLLNPFAYAYLILKSNPKELSLNIKLYRALKNSNCFDVGFYLNKYEDLRDSLWYKYFSLELHYVCNGFNEKRQFNKKYFNRSSKRVLLKYIFMCK